MSSCTTLPTPRRWQWCRPQGSLSMFKQRSPTSAAKRTCCSRPNCTWRAGRQWTRSTSWLYSKLTIKLRCHRSSTRSQDQVALEPTHSQFTASAQALVEASVSNMKREIETRLTHVIQEKVAMALSSAGAATAEKMNAAADATQHKLNHSLASWLESAKAAIRTAFQEEAAIVVSNLGAGASAAPLASSARDTDMVTCVLSAVESQLSVIASKEIETVCSCGRRAGDEIQCQSHVVH